MDSIVGPECYCYCFVARLRDRFEILKAGSCVSDLSTDVPSWLFLTRLETKIDNTNRIYILGHAGRDFRRRGFTGA